MNYEDSRPKTHPMRAKFRKQKADRLRAERHFDRVIAPRINFVEDTVNERLVAGKISPQDAFNVIEKEYLALGIDPDVSPTWQMLIREV